MEKDLQITELLELHSNIFLSISWVISITCRRVQEVQEGAWRIVLLCCVIFNNIPIIHSSSYIFTICKVLRAFWEYWKSWKCGNQNESEHYRIVIWCRCGWSAWGSHCGRTQSWSQHALVSQLSPTRVSPSLIYAITRLIIEKSYSMNIWIIVVECFVHCSQVCNTAGWLGDEVMSWIQMRRFVWKWSEK